MFDHKVNTELFSRKNIFLDFLSPDNWKTYSTMIGNMSNYQKIFEISLKLSIVLTDDYCVLPLGFVLQSRAIQNLLLNNKEFLEHKIIRFPLKEKSLDSFFSKKHKEYEYVKENHPDIYSSNGVQFITEYCRHLTIPRQADMGNTIASKWECASLDTPIWSPIVSIAPNLAEKVLTAPKIVKNRGFSVTLEAIKKLVCKDQVFNDRLDFYINQALQYDYIATYLEEYDLVIIKDIPPKPINTNYYAETDWLFYDYFVIFEVLSCVGIYKDIVSLSPAEIIRFRYSPTFTSFLKIYENYCCSSMQKKEVINKFIDLKESIKLPKCIQKTKNKFDSVCEILYCYCDALPRVCKTYRNVVTHPQIKAQFTKEVDSGNNKLIEKLKTLVNHKLVKAIGTDIHGVTLSHYIQNNILIPVMTGKKLPESLKNTLLDIDPEKINRSILISLCEQCAIELNDNNQQ